MTSRNALIALLGIAALFLGCTTPAASVNPSTSVSASVGILGATLTPTPTATSAFSTNGSAGASVGANSAQEVSFVTKDGWTLKGTFYPNPTKALRPVVILVHGLGEDRHTFDTFAQKLNDKDWSVLVFDSRGHGESTMHNGANQPWNNLAVSEFRLMPLDVAAAQAFVDQRVSYSALFLVGASIGANAVLVHAANASNISGVVLLSPGLEYQGLSVVNAVPTFKRPFYLAAALGDDYGLRSSLTIYNSVPDSTIKGFVRTEGPSHGSGMLNAVLPDGTRVDGVLIEWMESLV